MTFMRSAGRAEHADSRSQSSILPRAPLSAAEVREPWAFIHGDIMVGGIRQQLRSAPALCPRHTGGYAVVEVELWIAGAGSRGGHQPFDVCVLRTDMLDHVVGRLRSRGHAFHTPLAKTLQRQGPCRVCDALGPERDSGVLCLQHATQPGVESPVPIPALAEYVADLSLRVDALGRAMRHNAAPPTPVQNASGIEALGWFAGWDLPLYVTGAGKAVPQSRTDRRGVR